MLLHVQCCNVSHISMILHLDSIFWNDNQWFNSDQICMFYQRWKILARLSLSTILPELLRFSNDCCTLRSNNRQAFGDEQMTKNPWWLGTRPSVGSIHLRGAEASKSHRRPRAPRRGGGRDESNGRYGAAPLRQKPALRASPAKPFRWSVFFSRAMIRVF